MPSNNPRYEHSAGQLVLRLRTETNTDLGRMAMEFEQKCLLTMDQMDGVHTTTGRFVQMETFSFFRVFLRTAERLRRFSLTPASCESPRALCSLNASIISLELRRNLRSQSEFLIAVSREERWPVRRKTGACFRGHRTKATHRQSLSRCSEICARPEWKMFEEF